MQYSPTEIYSPELLKEANNLSLKSVVRMVEQIEKYFNDVSIAGDHDLALRYSISLFNWHNKLVNMLHPEPNDPSD